jgi:SAM-dependent methyltransferase
MKYLTDFYPESKFGGFSDIDGTVAFFNRVNALLHPAAVVVDFGCGRGAYADDPALYRRALRILKGKVGKVIGLDVDPAGANNPFLDEFHLLEGETWPVADGSVDLCLCDNALEHLEHPQAFFHQAHRTLKPGGYLCIRTPNAWSYIALLARAIPRRFHRSLLPRIQDRRREEDVFSAWYRCNTVPALRRALRENGFEGVVYGYEAEPSYLSFARTAYLMGVIHQRLAPGCLKPSLFVFAAARKGDIS